MFGAGPAVAGLAGASGIEQPNMQEEVGLPEAVKRAGTTVARPFIGAYNMLHDYITGSGDGKAVEAYNAGRKANLDYNDAAYEAHPAAYIAGQLAQAIATPLSGAGAAARTATALGRSARAAGAGAAGGALFGTGEGISKGESPGDVALGAGSGALTGAALGGAAHGLLEGGGQVIGRARQLLAGSRNPRAEASRMLTEAFGEDAAGGRLQGFAIRNFARDRFLAQNDRMGTLLRVMSRRVDPEQLIRAARAAAKPAYDLAYTRGSYGLWNTELERLTGNPDILDAMQRAARTGRAWAVNDGYGGFNPGVTFQNGQLSFARGANGQPSYPDLRFWDYVHRELAGAIGGAERSGNATEKARLSIAHSQLLSELDHLVPEFKAARGGYARFRRGADAFVSGQDFITSTQGELGVGEARRFFSRVSPAERDLFRAGAIQALVDRVRQTDDSVNVFKRIRGNPEARQKLEFALGPNNTRVIEAALNVEQVIDRLRAAGGNSVTTQGLHDERVMGAVGGAEALKESGFGFKAMLATAIGWRAVTQAAARTDERVATELADMLLSRDPNEFMQAVRRIAASRVLMEGLRRGTEAASRTAVAQNPSMGPAIAAGYLSSPHHHEEEHRHNYDDLLPSPAPQ